MYNLCQNNITCLWEHFIMALKLPYIYGLILKNLIFQFAYLNMHHLRQPFSNKNLSFSNHKIEKGLYTV